MQFLTVKEVCAATRMCRSNLYKLVKQGRFPRPVPLGTGARAVRWDKNEIEAWMAACITARG